jgi:GPI mannosyltransferase 3
MALGHAIAPDTTAHLFAVRLALAALSLVIVGAATALGLRLSRLHGAIAGFVAAIWFELVYFAPRALSEPIGLALLMGAVWLLVARRDPPGQRRFMVAGLLMGLCFVARIQYAPALFVLATFTARTDWRRAWLPLLAGGAGALAIDACANLAAGAVPFRWMAEVVRINIVERRADVYGVMPLTWYVARIGSFWTIAAVPILLLAWIGARRYPVLLWMAVVHFACHSLIGHKEYRFVLLTTALLVILAAIGTADLLRRIPRRRLTLAATGAAIVWSAGSAALAVGPFRYNWTLESDLAAALDHAGRPPATCGLALYRPRDTVAASYALYRRATPIYAIPAGQIATHVAAYDVIVTDPAYLRELPENYRQEFCAKPGITQAPGCVLRRRGGCTAGPMQYEVNTVLRATGN